MSKPSAAGLVRRLPNATPSLRSGSSCASSSSTASSASSASAAAVISQVTSAPRPAFPRSRVSLSPPRLVDQVADNFTLSLEAHAHDLNPLPDRDVASDSCSCSAALEGGERSESDELAPAATTRLAAFWGYVRVVALAVRAAVLAATLAVVVAGDVALAVYLFPCRGTV
jgi:hypothetical protein